ncbi:hypothetical protein CCP2SC5_1230008 [Azospirillaceae bacterium]
MTREYVAIARERWRSCDREMLRQMTRTFLVALEPNQWAAGVVRWLAATLESADPAEYLVQELLDGLASGRAPFGQKTAPLSLPPTLDSRSGQPDQPDEEEFVDVRVLPCFAESESPPKNQIRDLVSVSQVFQRFPRLVRDWSQSLGKSVELIVEGTETQVKIHEIEALSVALLHIVRNSLEHGVERLESRKVANKPDVGRLWLRAFRDGEGITVEVVDAGQGVDVDLIKQRALDKGLIDVVTADALSDSEAASLVFLPGFAWERRQSDLLWRGGGLGIARAAVEKEGGRLSLVSRRGEGTILRVFFPCALWTNIVCS